MTRDADANNPHPVDRHVGLAIRLRRRALGMSQQALAARLGITFQQVQKYERGRNRISASRLHDLAQALDAPVAAFFDGLPRGLREDTPEGTAYGRGREAAQTAPGRVRVAEMLAAPGGPELADAWLSLPSDKVRRRMAALLRAMGTHARAE